MTINTNRIWWIVANVLQEQRFLKNFSFLRSVSWEKIFFHKPTPRRLLKMLEQGVLVSRDGRININHKCWFPVSFKIKNKTVDPQNPPHTTVLRYLTIWWLFSRNDVCLSAISTQSFWRSNVLLKLLLYTASLNETGFQRNR